MDHECEYKNKCSQDSYAALSNDKKKELLAKRREYQRNRWARCKAEVKAAKVVETSDLIINQKNIQGPFYIISILTHECYLSFICILYPLYILMYAFF